MRIICSFVKVVFDNGKQEKDRLSQLRMDVQKKYPLLLQKIEEQWKSKVDVGSRDWADK